MPMLPEVYETFLHYLSERHLIWVKKEANEPVPWTSDPILASWKFTNVLRSRDRTTRWLVDHWYDPNRDQPPEVQALNCALARYFGRVEFLERLGYQKSWEPQKIIQFATDSFRQRLPVFTGAYIITNGGLSQPKQEVVVNNYLGPYRNALPELVQVAKDTQSWRLVATKLSRLPGMGAFMTKEILLDWQLTPLLENATDKLTWTPAGPGAIRGLNRLYGRPLQAGLSQDQALGQMQDLLARVAEDAAKLPNSFPQIGVDFGVTDIQFCLCELDKYIRVRNNEGRPRSGYKARNV